MSREKKYEVFRVTPETHTLVQALEVACIGLGGAERKGDIATEFDRLCVVRERLYRRLQEIERPRHRLEQTVVVRFTE